MASTHLTVREHVIDGSPEHVGPLRASDPTLGGEELRGRLADDGYLYLPGLLSRDDVLAARSEVLDLLRPDGFVGEGATPGPRGDGGVHSEVARRSDALQRVLYGPTMTGAFEGIFGEPVLHFDFSWLRALPPGRGTKPHMDTVFMNRGTSRLLTAWVPLGDVPIEMGGVAVLEGSHRRRDLQQGYAERDVDTYCVEDGPSAEWWNGTLREDADALRAEVGSRWLTGSYRAGDVLVFTMLTAHCGLDNRSEEMRLSCDIRYQPAAEPVDGRWVGPEPSAHGPRSKVGVIC